MMRRAVETLAALFAGAVLLDPVGEALFYGAEGFPVDGDAYGLIRLLSAPVALLLLVVGAAAAALVLPTRWRGWPAGPRRRRGVARADADLGLRAGDRAGPGPLAASGARRSLSDPRRVGPVRALGDC
jgi:hypothetical protein